MKLNRLLIVFVASALLLSTADARAEGEESAKAAKAKFKAGQEQFKAGSPPRRFAIQGRCR